MIHDQAYVFAKRFRWIPRSRTPLYARNQQVLPQVDREKQFSFRIIVFKKFFINKMCIFLQKICKFHTSAYTNLECICVDEKLLQISYWTETTRIWLKSQVFVIYKIFINPLFFKKTNFASL